jgi:hypothetical protein
MPHTIEISDQNFTRLQRHATPLVDTIDTILERALDALDGSKTAATIENTIGPKLYDPVRAPSLTFTQITAIELCGKIFKPNQWNALLLAVVDVAFSRLQERDKLMELIHLNCVKGRKVENGYKYVEAADVSIQGADSNNAWKAISIIAIKLRIPVSVTFVWQENPKASNPGVKGRFEISGD